MKIVFYSPDRHIAYDGSTPERVGVGGGITVRIRVAAALAALGHDVQMICNCTERIVCDGVEYKPLDSVKALNADIVIAQTSGGALDLTPLILLPVEARLRVLLLAGVDEPKAWEAFQPQLITACSEYVANTVWESWSPRPGKIFVCPYGITPQPPEDWPDRDLHSIVYTSHPSKGLVASIQVIRLLRRHDTAWNLHVFGGNRLWGGNDEPVVEAGVQYHGLVSQSFLRRNHPRFGFSLHLQRRLEPFGLTLVEAMAAGCVAIASPAGAYSEIIEHGRNGFLVPGDPESPETQQAAAALIRNLSDSPDEIAGISQNARSSPLSWETIARAWETWWRSELNPEATDGPGCSGCHEVMLRTPAGYHCQRCGKYRHSPHLKK